MLVNLNASFIVRAAKAWFRESEFRPITGGNPFWAAIPQLVCDINAAYDCAGLRRRPRGGSEHPRGEEDPEGCHRGRSEEEPADGRGAHRPAEEQGLQHRAPDGSEIPRAVEYFGGEAAKGALKSINNLSEISRTRLTTVRYTSDRKSYSVFHYSQKGSVTLSTNFSSV